MTKARNHASVSLDIHTYENLKIQAKRANTSVAQLIRTLSVDREDSIPLVPALFEAENYFKNPDAKQRFEELSTICILYIHRQSYIDHYRNMLNFSQIRANKIRFREQIEVQENNKKDLRFKVDPIYSYSKELFLLDAQHLEVLNVYRRINSEVFDGFLLLYHDISATWKNEKE